MTPWHNAAYRLTEHIPDTGWNRCRRCAGDEWLADIAVRLLIASDVKFYKQLNCVHFCVLPPLAGRYGLALTAGIKITSYKHYLLIEKNKKLSGIWVKCHHSLISSQHSRLHIHIKLHRFMISRFSGSFARTDTQTHRHTDRQTDRHTDRHTNATKKNTCFTQHS